MAKPLTSSAWTLRAARAFDWALALSLLLAVGRRVGRLIEEHQAPPYWGIVGYGSLLGVSALVAVQLTRRSVVTQNPTWQGTMAAAPTVLLGAVLCTLAPVEEWGPVSAVCSLLGCGLSAWAFLTLGKSFAVLPARRETVQHGPYRWIRHPAYSGELLALAGCASAFPSPVSLTLLVLTILLLGPRMRVEERLLASCPRYTVYRARIRYRLLPGVY